MRASVEHLHALHEHVVILAIETLPVPYVTATERLELDDLGYTDDGIIHAAARFGYADAPHVPALLRRIARAQTESSLDLDDVSYDCPPRRPERRHRSGARAAA